jgi:hypothetical protein
VDEVGDVVGWEQADNPISVMPTPASAICFCNIGDLRGELSSLRAKDTCRSDVRRDMLRGATARQRNALRCRWLLARCRRARHGTRHRGAAFEVRWAMAAPIASRLSNSRPSRRPKNSTPTLSSVAGSHHDAGPSASPKGASRTRGIVSARSLQRHAGARAQHGP